MLVFLFFRFVMFRPVAPMPMLVVHHNTRELPP
jgi:hypothetical protein